MPTLAYQPDLYPEDLLDTADLTLTEETTWWAMYCRSRQEKRLMRHLTQTGVAFYGPMIKRRFRSPCGHTQTSYVPLFPGYVFVYGTAAERHAAVCSGCVSRSLAVPNPFLLTDDLRRIRRLIEIGAPLTPEARLEKGMQVHVRSGPFAGFVGTVLRRANQTRLLVSVDFLQQGASVLLEDCCLEPID